MAKYPGWTGRLEALINALGGERNANGLIAGTKRAVIEDVVRTFFDHNGRCIPAQLVKSAVCDPSRAYHLAQPEIDYNYRLARIKRFLAFHDVTSLTAEEFQQRSDALLAELRADVRFANALNGVYLPLILPAMMITDYGETMESLVKFGVEASYRDQFPRRGFMNYRKGELGGKVSIVDGMRHDHLVERLTKGPVVGIYFPSALQGFSVLACREQIIALPDSWLLAGGIDTAIAMVAYSDVLARDGKTPALDCAALSWKSASRSLYFCAYDDCAGFHYAVSLGDASGNYGGGLVFLGSAL